MELVAKILKSIHTHESKKVTRENTIALMEKLYVMKLTDNAKKAEDIINGTLTYCKFPSGHACIHTNDVIKRLNWHTCR